MAVKEYGHSVKARLLNIARNEGQRYQLLLTRYFQERLLYRLSISEYRERFILKGGALLFAHEHFNARPTLDIDFMGRMINNDKETITNAFKTICEKIYPEDGVIFHNDTIRTTDIAVEKKYPGIRITMTATLDSVKQDISMDIGFGDIITPAPVELDYPTILDENSDVSLLAYSLETVVAEKFQTVIERGSVNSRMKDFFDLFTILKNRVFDKDLLQEAITATFINRNTIYNSNHIFFSEEFSKDPSLNTRWTAFMNKLNSPYELTFNDVVITIQQSLLPYWNNLGN